MEVESEVIEIDSDRGLLSPVVDPKAISVLKNEDHLPVSQRKVSGPEFGLEGHEFP